MDKLLEIQARLNSGAYNPADYKKNAKFLQDKIAFMANRNSKGQIRGKMGEAYALAKALLPRVEASKPEGAVAPPVAAVKAKKPVAENAGGAAAAPAPVKVPRAKTAKKAPAAAAGAVNATLAPFNVPGMNNVSRLRIRIPGKTRKSPKAKKVVAVNNMGGEGFWYNKPYPAPAPRRASKKRRGSRSKTAKKVRIESPLLAMNGNYYNRRIPASPANQPQNEYLEQAAAEYEPMIPELYDPFTGEKFGKEEDPLPPVEKAYIMLKKLRQKAYRRAATLRKTARKAGPPPAFAEAASVLRANAGEE
jgi:hypothetical protein